MDFGNCIYISTEEEGEKMIQEVEARKHFSLDTQSTGHKVEVAKGDKGKLLGHRQDTGYTIIINDKTINITDRQVFRYLFKIVKEAPKREGSN
jgi:hypothetical protein